MEFIIACVFIGLFIWLLPTLLSASIAILAGCALVIVGICHKISSAFK